MTNFLYRFGVLGKSYTISEQGKNRNSCINNQYEYWHKQDSVLFKALLLLLILISCNQTVSKVWLFEWQLLNSNDSTAITNNYSYGITVNQMENAANVTEDTLMKNGLLIFQIITVGDKHYIYEFPLTAMIDLELRYNNNVIADTSIPMNSQRFKKGFSILYNQEMQNINYDTLFVSNSSNLY